MSKLREGLKRVGFDDTLTCIEAAPLSGLRERFFVYMIPGTMGTALGIVLNVAFHTFMKRHPSAPHRMLTESSTNLHDKPQELADDADIGLAWSRLKFGHHEALPSRMTPLTVLADPALRLEREFRRAVDRLEYSGTASGFEDYLNEPANICRQCQHLSRLDIRETGPAPVYEDARANLDALTGCVGEGDVLKLVSRIWPSSAGVGLVTDLFQDSGIVEEHARIAEDGSRTPLFPELEDQLRELNGPEFELYERISSAPILPAETPPLEAEARKVCLVQRKIGETGLNFEFIDMDLDAFIDFLELREIQSLETFMHLARRMGRRVVSGASR